MTVKHAEAKPARAFKPALLLALLLPAAILMLPLTLVLIASLAPTMVARVIDSTERSFMTITIGCMNLVGSLYFVDQLWSSGAELENVLYILRDPIGWAAALAGAGCGWLLFLALPPLMARTAQAQTALRLRRLRKDQEQLVAEWGPEVAGTDK